MTAAPTRVAIVTGGASGIGRATVERLAADGALVIVWDRHPPADPVAGTVFKQVDVSEAASIDAALSAALTYSGAIDMLVNSAGIASGGSITDLEVAEWDRVMAVNLRGTMLVCKATLPYMIARGAGAIVNVGSTFGMLPREAAIAYGVSKAAIIHLTKCIAVDLAGTGVRINCVCPGLVETPLTAPVFAPEHRLANRREIDAHALRRSGHVDEIADAIGFLVSDAASYVTGSILAVDGGYTAGKWAPSARG